MYVENPYLQPPQIEGPQSRSWAQGFTFGFCGPEYLTTLVVVRARVTRPRLNWQAQTSKRTAVSTNKCRRPDAGLGMMRTSAQTANVRFPSEADA